MLLHLALLLPFFASPLSATNTAGIPTDLANWPPCAQQCIPQGFGPPANCGSLSNLECICLRGDFAAQIGICERTICNNQERSDIAILSQRLCAPVGGIGPAVSATLNAILSATPILIPTTPAINPSLTAATAVSSILATATLTPNLGNPANILSFPLCAQICNNETVAIAGATSNPYGDLTNLRNLCGPRFRSAEAGCQAATCNIQDYQNTQILAQQLCDPLYSGDLALGSSVTAAIASATAEAKAATEGKDPTDLSVYPPCGKLCIPQENLYGCGSLSNRLCVCQGIQFNSRINPCELNNCSPAELQTIIYLAEKLCEPVGGILTNPINYTGPPTGNFTNGSSSPPAPFTGEAVGLQTRLVGYLVAVLAVGVGLWM